MSGITAMVPKVKKVLFKGRVTSNTYYIALISLTVLFLVLMWSGEGGFTGVLGRSLGFFILVILSYSLIDWCLNITESSESWREKKELDEIVNLRMQDTSKTMNRASKGERICQRKLSEKIRNIFFIKLKEKKDLTEEEIKELLQDRDKFQRTVQDEVISDFILASYSDDKTGTDDKELTQKISSFFSPRKDPKEYNKEIEQVIRRVEEWD
ncbi:MAG: hypothetical protein KGY66_01705 [Candidatus Thermoplasmatota archaeon]|nr:hypothetical protein [Candidatus Thermoplasmatota archaeon]MBS3789612.1 hypothetical protein [Candidatus Thermoplasmatota archaeon]